MCSKCLYQEILEKHGKNTCRNVLQYLIELSSINRRKLMLSFALHKILILNKTIRYEEM